MAHLSILLRNYFIMGSLSVLIFACNPMDNGHMQPSDINFLGQYDTMREAMVRKQIVARGVSDKAVIGAMQSVPRHFFVPNHLWHAAYSDSPLPIGEEQTISQPYIVAFMTQALKLDSNMKVLEIGTGSGYQAAVLAELVREVYTIEIICSLAEIAEQRLQDIGYKNIRVKCGDGYQGWPDEAPFDGIIVTAAPEHIPTPLVEQLAVGGRMVVPVGKFFQELILITRTAEGIKQKSLLPVRFVPMTGEVQENAAKKNQ